MALLDWIVVVIYITIIIAISLMVGRTQKNQGDYYLGGKGIKGWQAGSSLVANQVSAISLVGAPAFIALKTNGGLKWLQYELAVPLAMIVIMVILMPALKRISGFTIYGYLEQRFGSFTRSLLSLVFLLGRSMGAGIALLATSYVTSVCLGLDLPLTIILIGLISLLYTTVGGIKADIYSDIIQLTVLWFSSVLVILVLVNLLQGEFLIPAKDLPRLRIFQMNSSGLGDGETFSFWPMLFGGLFLYISYYGCDQSQAQRLLATKKTEESNKALVFNGIVRFPLVLTYSVIGILLIFFLEKFPDFSASLQGRPPDYLMPVFFKTYIPAGLLGIVVAGIFAASMSSLDSAINSLSAASWEDFLVKIKPSVNSWSNKKKIIFSRLLTLFWGILAISFALYMSGGAETVIEMVNKIGSAFYGPVAAVFIMGIVTKRAGQTAAVTGLFLGVGFNIFLWLFYSSRVSWMWWNLLGFMVTFLSGTIAGRVKKLKPGSWSLLKINYQKKLALLLFSWFLFIVLFLLVFERLVLK